MSEENIYKNLSEETGTFTVSVRGGLQNAGSFEITNENMLGLSNPRIFWSYPTGTMIVRFMGDAECKSPFKLHLKHTNSVYEDIYLVRLVNGEEIPIQKGTNDDDIVTLESDSHNQCVVKVIGTPEGKYYGVSLQYDIEKL